ncbi:MAG TPA: hypothetical protein VMU08_02255 [Rhizomicrobium sp.]|nr:hypothetical protein [Rhizomicrobium sp.]
MNAQHPAPYGNGAADFMYNLLFCDDPALFLQNGAPDPASGLGIALSKKSDEAALRTVAEDAQAEGRTRMLAFAALRRRGAKVPARLLLGTIVEVPLDGGLDTLAAFSDGGVRYINQTGKMSVFETAPPAMAPRVRALLAASQQVVGRIGPWNKPRLPPPVAGHVRLSFLVSDGLYFGEGRFEDLSRDALGGPVIRLAGELLAQIAELATG